MDITYSFTDETDNYVGHASYDGYIYGDTYYKACTKAVRTLAEAQAAIETLHVAITKRFPTWERSAVEPQLVVTVHDAVCVAMQYVTRGES